MGTFCFFLKKAECPHNPILTQKKRPRLNGAVIFEDAAVVLLCCAVRSFLVRTSFDAHSCPVPTALLVSGYLRRNVTMKFRVSLSRPFGSVFPLSLPIFPGFRLPRPPPPTLAEARTSFSRAVVNKRTCWRVRLSPHTRIYGCHRACQRFRLYLFLPASHTSHIRKLAGDS